MRRFRRFSVLALLLLLVLGGIGWRTALAQAPPAPAAEPAAPAAPVAKPAAAEPESAPAEATAESAAPADNAAEAEPAAADADAKSKRDPAAVTSAVVRGPVGVIRNEGGNIGVLSGPEGILLVDAGFARQAEPIRAAIAALAAPPAGAPPSPLAPPKPPAAPPAAEAVAPAKPAETKPAAPAKPVPAPAPRLLVSTHFHADHTDGNAGFAASGAVIVAHENTRRRLAEGSMLEAFQLVTPPAAPEALPPITFERDLRLRFNGETIDLLHLPAAHTDGDVIVRFRDADVIHAADVWFNGMYPFIDTRHGATLAGAIAGVDRVLLLAGENTRIIPGHGPVGSRAELLAYRAMLATVQGRLAALKARGFTLPQVLEARPLADLEATWGQGLFKGDRWLELIWNGV